MLDRFPPEVLLLVLRQIRGRANFKSLSQVSKKLHQCAVPELYRSITFFASNEQNLGELGVESFLNRNSSYLIYVKEIHFAAHFHRQLRTRCPRDDEPETDRTSSNVAPPSQPVHVKFLEGLESQLIPLFNRFPDGSLEKFSWNLGTCVPKAIVNYLSDRQSNIKCLSIIFDITCVDRWTRPYDSFRFTQLRKISWRGHSNDESQALGEILRASAHLLEQADIGYVAPTRPEFCFVTKCNYFVHIQLELYEPRVLFSSLRRLSLSGIIFIHGVDDILSAFNFFQLRSLKLRDCLGTGQLLSHLAISSQALRLVSFELNFTGDYNGQRDLVSLEMFLLSFEGLKDLYILFPKDADLTEKYWHSITHHASALERVVHHPGTIYHNPQRIPSGDWHGHVGTLLARANLECLGICCLPDELTSSLAQLNPRPKVKLLHIRVTGYVTIESIQKHVYERADTEFSEALPDVFNFAHWAFGPDGLPELEILAYGDFSYQGRQPNMLLCRSQDLMKNMTAESRDAKAAKASNGPYRQVLKEDIRSWEIVQRHSDFLEACPEDDLMYQW